MARRAAAALLSLATLCPAQQRRVAITIDDLPVAHSGPAACAADTLPGLTRRLLEPLRRRRIPVTAFVIGGNCADLPEPQRIAVLRQWVEAGAELGNHTYSHRSLNTAPIAEYEADILRAEPGIRAATGGRPLRYFRSPMLHTGPTPEIKRRLEGFLAGHGYRQAPVTFDNSDWMFANVYAAAMAAGKSALAGRARRAYVPYMESVIEFFEQRSVEVAGREFPQVLLFHANRLNADALPDLLEMLVRRGYRFVPLDEALADDAYRLPNEYAGPGGFSWIHRWSRTKGMPNRGEPDEPVWIRQEYTRFTGRQP